MTDAAQAVAALDSDVEHAAPAPQSPGRVFWNQFRKSPLAVVGAITLGILYTLALFAQFVAPYPPDTMDREHFYHPPMRLHWMDRGRFHPLPFVYATTLADPSRFRYQDDRTHPMALRLFVAGTAYRLCCLILSRRHSFGV